MIHAWLDLGGFARQKLLTMLLEGHWLKAINVGGRCRCELVSQGHTLLIPFAAHVVSLLLYKVVSSFFRVQLLDEHSLVLLLQALASLEVHLLVLRSLHVLCSLYCLLLQVRTSQFLSLSCRCCCCCIPVHLLHNFPSIFIVLLLERCQMLSLLLCFLFKNFSFIILRVLYFLQSFLFLFSRLLSFFNILFPQLEMLIFTHLIFEVQFIRNFSSKLSNCSNLLPKCVNFFVFGLVNLLLNLF